jgi:hypothetical protein
MPFFYNASSGDQPPLQPNNGTLEVSGGGPHQLADVLDGPRLTIFGGESHKYFIM